MQSGILIFKQILMNWKFYKEELLDLCSKSTGDASPSAMINELGWETLAERTARSKAILMYEIQNDLIEISPNIFQPSNIHCCHSQAVLNIPTCRINCWKYPFVPTTVKIWNNLPMAVINSNNLQSFNSSLADMQIRSFN